VGCADGMEGCIAGVSGGSGSDRWMGDGRSLRENGLGIPLLVGVLG
jgi:hypothetical protein